jgi:hypothetical protein
MPWRRSIAPKPWPRCAARCRPGAVPLPPLARARRRGCGSCRPPALVAPNPLPRPVHSLVPARLPRPRPTALWQSSAPTWHASRKAGRPLSLSHRRPPRHRPSRVLKARPANRS